MVSRGDLTFFLGGGAMNPNDAMPYAGSNKLQLWHLRRFCQGKYAEFTRMCGFCKGFAFGLTWGLTVPQIPSCILNVYAVYKGICLCVSTKLCNKAQALPKYACFIRSLPLDLQVNPKCPQIFRWFSHAWIVHRPSTFVFPLIFELWHCCWWHEKESTNGYFRTTLFMVLSCPGNN